MFFVPLNQLESVELLVHALRIAAGEADCSQCPARRVCMKQCSTIADSIQTMIETGTLPTVDNEPQAPQKAPFHHEDEPPPLQDSPANPPKKGHLSVVK